MAKYDLLGVNFTDTLNASGLAAGATSATLTSGSFGSPSGLQLLVIDYDVPAKIEVVSVSIAGTALTSITRALSGTSDVAHAASAKVLHTIVPTHWAELRGIAASDAWTTFSSTIGGFSGTPTQSVKYIKTGRIVNVEFKISGTSNGSSLTFTLPNAATNTVRHVCYSVNNGTAAVTGMAVTAASSATVTCYSDAAENVWITSGSKAIEGSFVYESTT